MNKDELRELVDEALPKPEPGGNQDFYHSRTVDRQALASAILLCDRHGLRVTRTGENDDG